MRRRWELGVLEATHELPGCSGVIFLKSVNRSFSCSITHCCKSWTKPARGLRNAARNVIEVTRAWILVSLTFPLL